MGSPVSLRKRCRTSTFATGPVILAVTSVRSSGSGRPVEVRSVPWVMRSSGWIMVGLAPGG